ncbi:hypothetical protein ACFWIB_39795 [Streptomyces sp. NPDC127051]
MNVAGTQKDRAAHRAPKPGAALLLIRGAEARCCLAEFGIAIGGAATLPL